MPAHRRTARADARRGAADRARRRVRALQRHGAERFDAQAVVERLLGTAGDLGPFGRSAAKVPWLRKLARATEGVKPPRYPSLWETCVNASVYQQVSIQAAGAILRRVIERYGEPHPAGTERVFPFAAPATLVEADADELRGLGLSINKVVALRHVGRAILDGELNEAGLATLSTPELTTALTGHRGIGPWTAAVIAARLRPARPLPDERLGRGQGLATWERPRRRRLLTTLGAQRGMLYYLLLLGGWRPAATSACNRRNPPRLCGAWTPLPTPPRVQRAAERATFDFGRLKATRIPQLQLRRLLQMRTTDLRRAASS